MKNPDIHADDFGLSVATSKDLIRLMKMGCLDSISVVANTGCYEECMELLKASIADMPFLPCMSVHLNLVEGRALYENVSDGSIFYQKEGELRRYSWGGLFAASFNPFGYKKQLEYIASQMRLQIKRAGKDIEECIAIAKTEGVEAFQSGLRIDSHQHAHAIPIMWKALRRILPDTGCRLEYIRIPREPIMPYLRHPALFMTYRPVNFVKNLLLNLLSFKIDAFCRANDLPVIFIWGLVMSGGMDKERIRVLYPDMMSYSLRKKRSLELVFHPGTMDETEDKSDVAPEAFADFYNNKRSRAAEYEAVVCMKNDDYGYGKD